MSMTIRHDDAQERIDREASSWLIRIEEDGFDRDEQREFEHWLADDPRHRTSYEAMRQTWSEIAQVPGLADLTPAQERPSFSQGRPMWRWATGMAVAASLAAVALLFFDRPAPAASQYRTDLAETRIIALPDGSTVTLGARSSVTIAYSAAERRVVLASGEALFDVVHDAKRPFVVEAGASRVRDLGTRFDVNRTANAVRIGVIEGRIEVARTDHAGSRPVTIGGGESVRIAEMPGGSGGAVASPAAGQIVAVSQQGTGAWREGRLVFDNVRLADLAADVNRYYGPGVTLGSPAVGELRVTAAFKTSEIPAFMSALDATLPVRAERLPDGGFRIVDAPR